MRPIVSWTLLVFRVQKAVCDFWRRNPIKMALLLGACPPILTVALVFTAAIMTRHWELGLLRDLVIVGAATPTGLLTILAMARWAPNIPREEQRLMLANYPRGVVPINRRLSRLECALISSTQGAARQAWATQQAMEHRTTQATGSHRTPRL